MITRNGEIVETEIWDRAQKSRRAEWNGILSALKFYPLCPLGYYHPTNFVQIR